MPTRGDRLRQAREKVFRSARQAAMAMGVPIATYSAHERAQYPGGRDFSPEDAQLYARRFGVRTEHLLLGVPDKPSSQIASPQTLPVVGYADQADVIVFYREDKLTQVPAIEGAVARTVA